MDHREQPRFPGKIELVATLDQTRAALSRDLGQVGRTLNLSSQFRTSFASGRWRWLVGALVAGVATGIFLPLGRGKSKSGQSPAPARPVSSGLLGTVARHLLVIALEPPLVRFVGGQLDNWLRGVLRKS